MEDHGSHDRLKFYGLGDLANYMMADQAVAFIGAQSKKRTITTLNDALEIHNALEFERHDIVPSTIGQEAREALSASARVLRGQLAAFFERIDSSNIDDHLNSFEREYVQDLLHLIGRFNVTARVGGPTVFNALVKLGVPMWAMLGDRKFVTTHDTRLRNVLLSDAGYGELLVNIRLLKNTPNAYVLPTSLTALDSQQILMAYIDSESPHLNYVEAIAQAQDNESFGITTKIRLAAQRRVHELTEALFADEMKVVSGTSYAIGIDPEQQEPVLDRVKRSAGRTLRQRTFGGIYLKSSINPAQILANFSTVFEYLNERGLLVLPSFQSHIGVFERLRVSGKDTYPRGAAYRDRDSTTLLGTEAYYDFLRHEGIEVEDVLAWYFRDYIPEVFDITGFEYAPSTANSTYLERCRHICAEMESVVKQFTLYCEDGEIDRELLELTSAPRPWGKIPSLVERKYLVQSASEGCETALHLLFSDQSRLTYVNENLQARSFVQLTLNNQLRYEDLHHYQTRHVDWLATAGIITVDSGIISFTSLPMLRVLADINNYETAPFGHYELEEAAAENLVAKGWLEFRSTLLSSAEASYFNFFLNKSEFSDGHDLRNRYLHGTNPKPRDENAHRKAYTQLLRLAVALVLKIHDDLVVRGPRKA